MITGEDDDVEVENVHQKNPDRDSAEKKGLFFGADKEKNNKGQEEMTNDQDKI